VVNPIGTRPVTGSDRVVAPVARAAAPVAVETPTRSVDTQLAAVASEAAASPPIDQERVARIRDAVRKGSFPIYPTQIADRLIALKYEWKPHDAE